MGTRFCRLIALGDKSDLHPRLGCGPVGEERAGAGWSLVHGHKLMAIDQSEQHSDQPLARFSTSEQPPAAFPMGIQ